MDGSRVYPVPANPVRITFQQAISAKKEQWKTARSTSESNRHRRSAPLVAIQKMVSPSALGNDERSASVFRESLRFFQSQEEKGKVPRPDNSASSATKVTPTNGHISSSENKSGRTANNPPSVDKILSNVKAICSTKNAKNVRHISMKSVISGKSNHFPRTTPTSSIEDQPFNILGTSCESTSETESDSKVTTSSTCNKSRNNTSLSSKFNPSFNTHIEGNIVKTSTVTNNNSHPAYDNNFNNANSVDCVVNSKRNNAQTFASAKQCSELISSLLNGKATLENVTVTSNENNFGIGKSNQNSHFISTSPQNVTNSSKNMTMECSCGNSNTETPGTYNKTHISIKPLKSSETFNCSKVNNKTDGSKCLSRSNDETILFSQAQSPQSNFMLKSKNGMFNDGSSKRTFSQQDSVANSNAKREINSYLEKCQKNLCDNNTLQISLPTEQNECAHISNPTNISYTEIEEKFSMDSNHSQRVSTEEFNLKNSNIKSDTNESTHIKDKHDNKSPFHFIEVTADKSCDSFESDYDPQDFIVHKTTYSDDYLDVTSEDAYRSINDDYEVEHPDDTEADDLAIPSPDYASEEEEVFLVHQGIPEYEDEDDENDEYLIDNNKNYTFDSRHFLYYADDKELEVIPEEDEEDLEDDEDCYSQGFSDQGSPDYQSYRHVVKGNTNENVLTECDSGVADDHSSGEDYIEEEHLQNQYRLSSSLCRINDELINGCVSMYWDPTRKLLPTLYQMYFKPEEETKRVEYINIEGSAMLTLDQYGQESQCTKISKWLKHWPPRPTYVKIIRGTMALYANRDDCRPLTTIALVGCNLQLEDNGTLVIDDKKGNCFIIYLNTDNEVQSWKAALETHIKENYAANYCVPNYRPITSFYDVLLVDIGGTSIRAGLAMCEATLPMLYFPAVCLTNTQNGERYFGIEALHPDIRRNCKMSHPFTQPNTIQFTWDMNVVRGLLRYIVQELRVEPSRFKLLLTTNRRMTIWVKRQISSIVLKEFHMKSLHVSYEAYAAISGYNSETGIIVEVGDRINVTPLSRGFLIPAGETTSGYGSPRLIHHTYQQLCSKNSRSFGSAPSSYLIRYIIENMCYISQNCFHEEKEALINPQQIEKTLDVGEFFKRPLEQYTMPSLDCGRFLSTEGLFEPHAWGLDMPSLPHRILRAVEATPVDCRVNVIHNIYVSGGLSLLPGFKERLFSDCCKLLQPMNIKPIIHCSEYRLHMSYLGSYQIATCPNFNDYCIGINDLKHGDEVFERWKI